MRLVLVPLTLVASIVSVNADDIAIDGGGLNLGIGKSINSGQKLHEKLTTPNKGPFSSVSVVCEACLFCRDTSLSIGGDRTNFEFTRSGAWVTVMHRRGGVAAGRFTYTCSTKHDGRWKLCTGSMRLSGSKRYAKIDIGRASKYTCENVRVFEH